MTSKLLLGALVLCALLPAGGRAAILLEQDEIQLLDDPKQPVKAGLFERDTELKKRLDKKIFSKLGVKDAEELKAKNLEAAYREELDKLVKVRPMEKPQLRFFDKQGKLVGLVPLASENLPETKVFRRVRDGKPAWTKQFIRKRAFVAPDGSGAGVAYTIVERWVSTPTAATGEYLATYNQIEWYGPTGKLLWSKPLDKETVVEQAFAAPGVPVLAVHQGPAPESPDDQIKRKFWVAGPGGATLLELPRYPIDPRPAGDPQYSPNGHYLCLPVSKEGWAGGVLVLNTLSKRTWNTTEALKVYGVSNSGEIEFEARRPKGLERIKVQLGSILEPPPAPKVSRAAKPKASPSGSPRRPAAKKER